MARLAEWLGKEADCRYFEQRARSYATVFDKEWGWFRPRGDDGAFLPLPASGRLAEGYGCIECNLYQQGWFVPHDIDGLVNLLGGREKALADLQQMFEQTPDDYLWNAYYNHANEPVHHIPFLFNCLGASWLTQRWTRDICRNAYHNSDENIYIQSATLNGKPCEKHYLLYDDMVKGGKLVLQMGPEPCVR